GTPPYRSPEAYRFALHIRQQPVKIYSPTPADDLFALGVTAYKLVTGEYPPAPEPLDPRFHVWKTEGPGPQPAHELNPRCAPELSALSSRMLSLQPEARGSARELAEALEHAAREAGPEADAPLFVGGEPRPTSSRASGASQPSDAEAPLQPIPLRARGTSQPSQRDATPQFQAQDPSWRPRLALASAAGVFALGFIWVLDRWGPHAERPQFTQQEQARDAGTVGVGDSVLTAPVASAYAPSAGTLLAQEIPAEPFPGQIRTDAHGRCPEADMIPLKGGCWMKIPKDLTECARSEASYVYKGACYMPAFRIRGRPATSSPPETGDGG
ncbi:MAG TPA: serine/threonine protein kinase, partial [Myxococcus sp.]|nr:serine/threonine protein kinase [Myxococcus sp.]